jgi:hypothetical protein
LKTILYSSLNVNGTATHTLLFLAYRQSARLRYGCRSSQADKADVIEAVTDLCWLEQGHAPQPIHRDWWRAATVREGRK